MLLFTRQLLLCFIALSCSSVLFAVENDSSLITSEKEQKEKAQKEKDWGVGFVQRISSIPYAGTSGFVYDVVPELYYEGEYLFLRGTYGGLRFVNYEAISLSLMGAFRYFDIPQADQNAFQGSDVDAGLQFEYVFADNAQYQLEWMSDSKKNYYINNHLRHQYAGEYFYLDSRASLRFKSAGFNDRYYGLDWLVDPDTQESIGEAIGSDFDLSFGSKLRYHLWSNLYFLGEANLRFFGPDTVQSEVVGNYAQGEVFFGLALFNEEKKPSKFRFPEDHYLRLAYGWATPSNIGEIIFFEIEDEPQNNRLASLFYGMPLSKRLFNSDIHSYLTAGFVHHFASSEYVDPVYSEVLKAQEESSEYVIAVKFYYTLPWPVKWRLGFAEGLSYVSSITNVEQVELDEKEYETSKLMNYLDLSLDINLGELLNYTPLDGLWLGYSMHHRSAIFEANSSFGRIKGGSNYNTLYLQWHW